MSDLIRTEPEASYADAGHDRKRAHQLANAAIEEVVACGDPEVAEKNWRAAVKLALRSFSSRVYGNGFKNGRKAK